MQKHEMRFTLSPKNNGDNVTTIESHTTHGLTALMLSDDSKELTIVFEDPAYIDSVIRQLQFAREKMVEQQKKEPHKYWRTEPRELNKL